MVATNANTLLLGLDGRLTLNFSPAKGPPKYNHTQKNVIVAWDVLMQDFRTINCQACNLIKTVPANEEFWNYFKKELLPMTAAQKVMFMDS